MLRGPCWFEPVFDTVACVSPLVNAELARERICSALDAIDAAHEALRQTPSDAVGNAFRVDVAERLEAQDRANRGLMYRISAKSPSRRMGQSAFRRYAERCGRGCASLPRKLLAAFGSLRVSGRAVR